MKTTLEQRDKILIKTGATITKKFHNYEGSLRDFDAFVIAASRFFLSKYVDDNHININENNVNYLTDLKLQEILIVSYVKQLWERIVVNSTCYSVEIIYKMAFFAAIEDVKKVYFPEPLEKTYRIPCSWKVCGEVSIKASSKDEAIRIAKFESPLPEIDCNYLDESFEVNEELCYTLD